MFKKTSILLILLGFSTSYGQASDPATTQALRDTQALLTQPEKRNKALKQDPKAYKAHQNMVKAVGAENAEKTYQLTSDIMGGMVQKSGGDPKKLNQMIIKFQKNPQAFYETLTPAQKKAIKDMSESLKPRNPSSR